MKMAVQLDQFRLMGLRPGGRVLGANLDNSDEYGKRDESGGIPSKKSKRHGDVPSNDKKFSAGTCKIRRPCSNAPQVIALIFIWPALAVITGAGLIFCAGVRCIPTAPRLR